jgi:hypothetical protein
MVTIERFKEYLDAKGIANARAEKDCGFSNGLIGNAFKTKTAMGSDKLEKILRTYSDLSAEWLLRGVGSMIIGEGKSVELENKITSMTEGGKDRDKAYDIVIGMIDVIGKTYDFYKG